MRSSHYSRAVRICRRYVQMFCKPCRLCGEKCMQVIVDANGERDRATIYQGCQHAFNHYPDSFGCRLGEFGVDWSWIENAVEEWNDRLGLGGKATPKHEAVWNPETWEPEYVLRRDIPSAQHTEEMRILGELSRKRKPS